MRRARLFLSLAGLVGVVSLNGCLLGPNYSREPVPTPATFRFAAAEVADTANTEWWKQFQDPVLDDLIATALANNKDVKIAAARVRQFMGQFVTTRSALFPKSRQARRRHGSVFRGQDRSLRCRASDRSSTTSSFRCPRRGRSMSSAASAG